MVIVIFSYYKELLIKERIRSLLEQILSFKRSSHFEKGHNLFFYLSKQNFSLNSANI